MYTLQPWTVLAVTAECVARGRNIWLSGVDTRDITSRLRRYLVTSSRRAVFTTRCRINDCALSRLHIGTRPVVDWLFIGYEFRSLYCASHIFLN